MTAACFPSVLGEDHLVPGFARHSLMCRAAVRSRNSFYACVRSTWFYIICIPVFYCVLLCKRKFCRKDFRVADNQNEEKSRCDELKRMRSVVDD